MVSREHSGGWAPQCAAVLAALLCTPTLLHSSSASDNLSISRSISRPYSCRSPCLPLSSPSSRCFCLFNAKRFRHTLEADSSPRVQHSLSFPSLLVQSCSPLRRQSCRDEFISISVMFPAKMTNVIWFRLLKCKELMLFVLFWFGFK